jgi:hypothetical protein
MPLADPLVVCRDVLLKSPPVTAICGGDVYATPLLPVGHGYPLIRLLEIGRNNYGNVPFRHSADALIQMDVWAYSMPEMAALREAALDALHRPPPPSRNYGVARIATTSEVVTVDETVQPPLYRCRADLVVRVAQILAPVAP